MIDRCVELGLRKPEYEVAGGFVRIVFRRPEGAGVVNGPVNGDVNGGLNGELNGELNASQKATQQFIIEHEGCTASGISEMTKIPFSTIDKHVRVLLKVGMIERRGSKKTGGYYVK